MRVKTQSDTLTVNAIAGTRAVLFGFDVPDAARKDLLGFAIERTDRTTATSRVLPNFLRLAANDRPDGPAGTDANPLQAFQWGDYTVAPGQQLSYRVDALYTAPEGLRAGDSVTFDIDTELEDDGRNGIWFNRGVAGSQAYARKFGEGSPLENPEAQTWLSRGLEEALLAFIARAEGPDHGLRGALYEFQHAPALKALHDAAKRGADVKLSVSCPLQSSGWPEYPSWHNIEAIRLQKGSRTPKVDGLSKYVKPRLHADAIAHNKFIVLLHHGEPVAVWTGSTNFTAGAFWGHSNVGHLVGDADVARQYLAYWEQLHADAESRAALPGWTTANSPIEPGGPVAGTSTIFSPRADEAALSHYVDLIKGAGQSVFFTAAFGVASQIEPAFRQNTDVLRYLLLETPDNDMELARVDPDNQIASGAFLGQEGGWRQFLTENLTGLNEHVQFIHTKYLLVDPLTDHPIVVTGSANFSKPSTVSNDENMLVIRGDLRVADIYLTEFMRLFTHLRFRSRVANGPADRAPDPNEPDVPAPLHLDETDGWTDEYYAGGTPKARERLLFAGKL